MSEEKEITEIQNQVDKLKNILYCFEKRDRKDFMEIFKEYFLYLFEIVNEFECEDDPKFQDHLRKLALRTQISYKDFCWGIRSFMSMSGVKAIYNDREGKICSKTFVFDFDGDEEDFIDVDEVASMWEECDYNSGAITVTPLKSNVKNMSEQIEEALDAVQDEVNHEKKMKGINNDLQCIFGLEFFETKFSYLKTMKKFYSGVLEDRKNLKNNCIQAKLVIEFDTIDKIVNYTKMTDCLDCLPQIHYRYFTLIRKICLVRSTLKQEDTDYSEKLQEKLQSLLSDFRNFNSNYSFFIENPKIGFSSYHLSANPEFEFDLESILSLDFLEDVSELIKTYEADTSRIRFAKNKTQMEGLLNEMNLVKMRLASAKKCKVCLNDAKFKIKELQEKHDWSKISIQAAEIVAHHSELKRTLGLFDDEYKPLYIVNDNESFFYDENGHEIEEECAICMGDFTDGDVVVKLNCSHYFCKKCLVEWTRESMGRPTERTCPLCRGNI